MKTRTKRIRIPVSEVKERLKTVPSLWRVQWEHIHRVVMDCDGNLSMAARLLGVHRRTLQRKLGRKPPVR